MLKKLAVLALIAAALAAAAAYLRARSGQIEEAPLHPYTIEQVVRVELSRGPERLILQKTAGKWSVAEPKPGDADPTAAEALAGALRDLRLGAVVSREPDRDGAYGLGAGAGTRVKVFVENKAAPVVDGAFGAAALGGAALYYRADRDSAIRLAGGVPPAALTRPASDYLARK